MGKTRSLLEKHSQLAAKPIAIALLYCATIIWLCLFIWLSPNPAEFFVHPGMPVELREHQLEIVKNFGALLNSMLQWNFGQQFPADFTPVLPELMWRTRWTLVLIGLSTVGSIIAGTLIASIVFIRKPKEQKPMTLAHSMKGLLFGLTPFIGLLLVNILVLRLGLFPRAGLFSVGSTLDPGTMAWYIDLIRHLFLPVLTLTLVSAIRTAVIIWSGSFSLGSKSIWKIFGLSVTTINFPFMVSAAVFVESMFSIPGLGQLFVGSLTFGNHPGVFASFVALLAIALGLELVSVFLDLIQVTTGIREDLVKPLERYPQPEDQTRGTPTKTRRTDYFKRKSLFVGLVIVSFFIILGIAAPFLTPYLPSSLNYEAPRVAVSYAMPEWATMFSEDPDYNPALIQTFDSKNVEMVNCSGPIEVNVENFTFSFNPDPEKNILQKASATLHLGNITYEYRPPPQFTMRFSFTMYLHALTDAEIYFIIKNYTANPNWEEYLQNPNLAQMKVYELKSWPYMPDTRNISGTVECHSYQSQVRDQLFGWPSFTEPDPAQVLFSEKGVYGVQIRVEFQNVRSWSFPYGYESGLAELELENVGFDIWAAAHGLFGTNYKGNDVWTELVYGTRTIIIMSLGLAALAVMLGMPFGILAGHFKGWTDNIVMVATETFLAIPIIPLLLINSRYVRPFNAILPILFWFLPAIAAIAFRNLYMTKSTNVKSVKNKVTALFKYSLANFCLTVISVSLILTSIEFLGFGDPNTATWGRMLYHTFQLGGFEAWWTWIPPIGFILLYTSGLFLLGSSLEEV